MATHSSVLAWRIPGTAEPAGLYGVAESRTRLKRLSSSSSCRVCSIYNSTENRYTIPGLADLSLGHKAAPLSGLDSLTPASPLPPKVSSPSSLTGIF